MVVVGALSPATGSTILLRGEFVLTTPLTPFQPSTFSPLCVRSCPVALSVKLPARVNACCPAAFCNTKKPFPWIAASKGWPVEVIDPCENDWLEMGTTDPPERFVVADPPISLTSSSNDTVLAL